MRIDVRNGTEIWQPTHRGKLVGRTDLSILDQYNGEIRGFCNYYAIANNRSKLHKFRYIMEYSFIKLWPVNTAQQNAESLPNIALAKTFV